jgi:hypothetical protein
LDERGLKVAQAEGRFEVRDENVIQVHAERPQKKQTGDQDKGHNVFSFCERSGLRRQVSSCVLRRNKRTEKQIPRQTTLSE